MMKKIYWKMCAALCSAVAVVMIAYGVIYACAGGDEFWMSDFAPEAYVNDSSYMPLFYAPTEVFYGIGFDTEHVSRFNEANVEDWLKYIGDNADTETVKTLLLNDEDGKITALLNTAVQTKKRAAAPYDVMNVADEKVKNFITFMQLAKEIETSSTFKFEYWDYDETKKAPVTSAQVVARAEKLYAETKDTFLKNRYWFQAMKANFYSANRGNAINFFEKTQNTIEHNTLYYRGLAYVAGAQYKAKNYTVSNYLYSVVFHGCPALRTMAAYNFHPQEQADFQAALTLTKTADERAALWALFGYYADEVLAIQEIYKVNPKSEHLDYLLTRLVNKQEWVLNGESFHSADEYRKHLKEKSNKEALQVVTTIAREGKTHTPHLWNLAAGFLNIYAGNNALATQLFDKVEKEGPKSALATDQLHVLRLFNTLHSTTTMTAAAEGRLVTDLNWLYNAKKENNELRDSQLYFWSRQYISFLYKQQGNAVYAELFNPDVTFYRKPANTEAMKAFLHKGAHTPWETMIKKSYNVTLGEIYEYQGIMSAYAGKLDEAIGFFQQGKVGDAELLGNPFNGKIKDCHDCDHAAAQKVKYTKLAFLQKMKEMQMHIDKNEDVYNNSLLLASAYYNMTYYGNARVFYYNRIVGQDGNDIDEYFAPQLLNCATADRYYKMAFAAATTDEQRAKCVYMMAKCERNHKFKGDPEHESLAWDGFVQLKTKYAQTKYYKEVLKECGYFSIYLNQ